MADHDIRRKGLNVMAVHSRATLIEKPIHLFVSEWLSNQPTGWSLDSAQNYALNSSTQTSEWGEV